ncbi:protein kinase superfamily protein [Striga asiatica]|uniref:Protein kinase superfamily protein n=1 Tax=Striga asiatica TaxID=4170 RepID=A0A5A7RG66_STRAF|nr:protein kinase superfamily protein [Striga asiatica]
MGSNFLGRLDPHGLLRARSQSPCNLLHGPKTQQPDPRRNAHLMKHSFYKADSLHCSEAKHSSFCRFLNSKIGIERIVASSSPRPSTADGELKMRKWCQLRQDLITNM